jgi:hypothetical protein
VTVQDEIRLVLADRRCDPLVPEERPDALGLATQRLGAGRVVQQDDPIRAVGDLSQAFVERRHVIARLPVHLAQQRLAEVGQARAGEAADESLEADDPDLAAIELDDARLTLEHGDSALLEQRDQFIRAILVPVVVAEHGEHGHVEPRAGLREPGGLLGLAVRRQVARQQYELNFAVQARERFLQLRAVCLADMYVACRGDAD